MKVARFVIGFLLVVGLAAVLRLYQLGSVPHGMTWDEAAIAYNGFAVVTTRRDEWLAKLPISFRSFGDYKAPLAVYVNGIFTTVFGLELWAVRLPFALAGIVAVAVWMLLMRALFGTILHGRMLDVLTLGAGALLAVSPWHLQFSRSGFESGMALTLLLLASFCFVQVMQAVDSTPKKYTRLWAVAAAIFAAFAMYTYHSAKIAVPLVLLSILFYYSHNLRRRSAELVLIGVVTALLLLPLTKDTFLGKGGERFQQTSVFSQKLPISEVLGQVAGNAVAQFSPAFLVLGETTTLRHGDGQWGVLFPTTAALVLVSFLAIRAKEKKVWWLGMAWVVAGSIPALIGTDVPHSNRALLALPGFLLLASLGGKMLYTALQNSALNRQVSGSNGERDLLVKSVFGMLVFLQLCCVAAYLHHYYTTFAMNSAGAFQDGYVEAMQYVKDQEDSVDQVIFTSAYGQPYIYALLVRRTSPIYYHGGSLVKYLFPDTVTVGDLLRKKALVVGTPEELDPRVGEKLIYGSDGQVRFVVARTKNEQ